MVVEPPALAFVSEVPENKFVDGRKMEAEAGMALVENGKALVGLPLAFGEDRIVDDKPLVLVFVEDGTKGTKLKFIAGKALGVLAFVDSKALSVPAFAEDGKRLGLLVEGKGLAGEAAAARLELP